MKITAQFFGCGRWWDWWGCRRLEAEASKGYAGAGMLGRTRQWCTVVHVKF